MSKVLTLPTKGPREYIQNFDSSKSVVRRLSRCACLRAPERSSTEASPTLVSPGPPLVVTRSRGLLFLTMPSRSLTARSRARQEAQRRPLVLLAGEVVSVLTFTFSHLSLPGGASSLPYSLRSQSRQPLVLRAVSLCRPPLAGWAACSMIWRWTAAGLRGRG